MATILVFETARPRERCGLAPVKPLQPCEVLLFTGVRYERTTDDSGVARSSRRRKRDRIELGE